MKIAEKTNIISNAIATNVFCNYWKDLSAGELKAIFDFIDVNKVPDRTIADNENIKNIINWDKITNEKLLRLIVRDNKIIDTVDIKKRKYKLKSLKFLLNSSPKLIYKFNFDFTKTINKEDAYFILTFNGDFFKEEGILDKVLNNINPSLFSEKQKFEILKNFDFDKEIIQKLDVYNFNDFYISEILKEKDESYIELFDLKKISAKKWAEILAVRPEYLHLCDFNKFLESDIYNTVLLVCLFKNLFHMITDRDFYNELTPMGWRKLLISYPEFINFCNVEKLRKSDWNLIILHHPELEAYKL